MARRGDIQLRIALEGAGRSAREFTAIQRRLQDAVVRELRKLGRNAEDTFKSYAPRDSDRLYDSIRTAADFYDASRPTMTVRADATMPFSRFNYLPNTRFGHSVARIYPRRATFLTVHDMGRDRSGRGPFRLAKSVAGARPGRDWVADATTLTERDFEASAARLGRAVLRA